MNPIASPQLQFPPHPINGARRRPPACRFPFLCALVLAATGLIGPSPAPAQGARNLFLELADFESIALRRDSPLLLHASTDPTGGNQDYSNYIPGSSPERVILDTQGAGAVARIYFSVGHQELTTAALRVYLDGDLTLHTTIRELVSGELPGFPRPLVGTLSGGYHCYVPLHYRQRCRMTIESYQNFYYQVETRNLPWSPDMRTFDGTHSPEEQEALDRIIDQWSALGEDPKPPPDETTTGAVEADTGESVVFFEAEGTGQIGRLWLDLGSTDTTTLEQTRLEMWVDGRKTIDCPVGLFFGMGLGETDHRSLAFGLEGGGYYCYLPMPFASDARLALAADGPPVEADFRVGLARLESIDDRGVLNAVWNHDPEAADPYVLMDVSGRAGHYAGAHMCAVSGNPPGMWFLEGDERTYIDGDPFPTNEGNGMEDYFNGSFYFAGGRVAGAISGCTVREGSHEPPTTSSFAMYRYRIHDAIPFGHSLRVTFEAYEPQDFRSVAFWYDDGERTVGAPTSDYQAHFTDGEDNWLFYTLRTPDISPVEGVWINRSLGVWTDNNINNFGFWDGWIGTTAAAPDDVFRARFEVMSNVPDPRLNPTLRLRINHNVGEQVDGLVVNSMGVNVAPDFGGQTYEIHFTPCVDPVAPDAETHLAASMDVINFNRGDQAVSLLRLDSFTLDRCPESFFGMPVRDRRQGFGEDAGWSYADLSSVFDSPETGCDDESVWMRAVSANCVGSWNLVGEALTLPLSDSLMKITLRFDCDAADRRLAPGFRVRLNSQFTEMVRSLTLSSVGDATRSPGAAPRDYELYFRPPTPLERGPYTLSFDLIGLDPFDAADAAVRLSGCRFQEFRLAAWP